MLYVYDHVLLKNMYAFHILFFLWDIIIWNWFLYNIYQYIQIQRSNDSLQRMDTYSITFSLLNGKIHIQRLNVYLKMMDE